MKVKLSLGLFVASRVLLRYLLVTAIVVIVLLCKPSSRQFRLLLELMLEIKIKKLWLMTIII